MKNLTKLPNPTLLRLRSIFHFSACRNILGHEEESILRKIKIKIALKTKIKIGSVSSTQDTSSVHMANLRSSSSNRPTDGWQCFSLQYSVAWPLHLVITPSVIDKYNEILKFLLFVRRTQCKLHETWANQKKIEVIHYLLMQNIISHIETKIVFFFVIKSKYVLF